MATQPCQGQHHQLEVSGAQEGDFIKDAGARVTAPVETYLRYQRATVIPFSLEFCEATCVFAHQKMRGVFVRAFLHHVVFPAAGHSRDH